MCVLSHSSRRCLAYFSLVLQMCCMLLGALIITAGSSIKVAFSEYERIKYEHLGEAFPNFLIAVGIIHLLYHTFGVQASLMVTDWRKIYIDKTIYRSISFFFIITNLFFIVVLIVTAFLLVNYPDNLREAWIDIFNESMQTYASNLDNKAMIDHLQFSYKCCGSKDDRDWHRVKWLRKGKIPQDSSYAFINKQIYKNFFRGEGVPWSCCDSAAPSPCINIFYRDASKHNNYSPDVDGTIYTRGCGYAISKEIGYWMNILGVLTYCFSIIEVFALMIFRILQTSADLALDWGDPTQAAQGYLCVCDVPPVPPGATLDPDKLAIRQQVLDEIAYKDEDEIDAMDNLKLGLMNKAWQADSARDEQDLANNSSNRQTNLTNNSKFEKNTSNKLMGKVKSTNSYNNETGFSEKSNSIKRFDKKLKNYKNKNDGLENFYYNDIELIRDQNSSRISSSSYSCSNPVEDANLSDFESVSQRMQKKYIFENIKTNFNKKLLKIKSSIHCNKNNKVKEPKKKKTFPELYDFHFNNIKRFSSHQTSLQPNYSHSVTDVSNLDEADDINVCYNTSQNNADITTIWDSSSITSLTSDEFGTFKQNSINKKNNYNLFSKLNLSNKIDSNAFGKHEYLLNNSSNQLSFAMKGEDKFMCGKILKIPVNTKRIYSDLSSASSNNEKNDNDKQNVKSPELCVSNFSLSNKKKPLEAKVSFLDKTSTRRQTTGDMMQIKPRSHCYLSPFRPIKYPVYRDNPPIMNKQNRILNSDSSCNLSNSSKIQNCKDNSYKNPNVETDQTSNIGTEEMVLIDLGNAKLPR